MKLSFQLPPVTAVVFTSVSVFTSPPHVTLHGTEWPDDEAGNLKAGNQHFKGNGARKGRIPNLDSHN